MSYLGLGSSQLELELLQKLAILLKTYPDAPANFIPPRLIDPTYVPVQQPQRKAIEAACVFLVVLPIVVVLLRLLTRGFLKTQTLGLDDASIAIALFTGIGFWTTNVLLFEKAKVGYHTYDLAYSELQAGVKLQLANIFFYVFTVSFIRFSVLLFTARLTKATYSRMSLIIKLSIGFQTAWMITILSLALFSCKPVEAMWNFDARLAGGECKYLSPAMLGTAILWVILDIWVVSLPIPLVIRLEVPLSTRCGVVFLFALGYLASCASLIRVFLIRPVYDSWDPAWNAVHLLLWDEIEIGFGFIAASLPALNSLFIRIIPSWCRLASSPIRSRNIHGHSKQEYI